MNQKTITLLTDDTPDKKHPTRHNIHPDIYSLARSNLSPPFYTLPPCVSSDIPIQQPRHLSYPQLPHLTAVHAHPNLIATEPVIRKSFPVLPRQVSTHSVQAPSIREHTRQGEQT
jgi:hypothetical protein